MNATSDHILIIGTGFAGLCMGIRLKQAGIHDFTILEEADEVGGTWRDNHYPGAACDIQSHLYSFSFEPNPRWTRMFALQAEILEYLKHCADKYGLRPHIKFNARVAGASFDERTGTWEVATADGKTYRGRLLVSGSGGLSRPSIPEIPGLPVFEGKAFHSARWDHGYSLEGKTVGVVGTGASGIQIVPEIAPKVRKLYLFQRTPPWILPKPDRAIGPMERAIFARAPGVQQLVRRAIYWQLEWRAVGFVVQPAIMKLAQKQALQYLRRRVADPVLRKKLTPNYLMGCKRILMSNDYFETLQRPNVEVVTDPIHEVRARGLATTDGQERPLDALVLATGFQAAEAAAPFHITGRGGRDLNEAWRPGAEAYLGTTVAGFPNMFLIVGPNTGLGHNSMVFMIESQVQYVMSCVEMMRARRLKQVDVRPDVQAAYNARIHERLGKTVWASGCHSWYQTSSGKNTTLWPGFTVEYRLRTRAFDDANYELVPQERASQTNGIAARAPAAAVVDAG
jgi:cation diffusion facilitator CzcD-associated flavoprotein CzcO